MEAGGAKGTVTPVSSLFPAEDALKAATRVQDVISEKQREREQLQSFISDNANLINLVQKLPEELYHEVMVPFGKAAFFPGRLIHTNEFLVLLGEGYYAERTSKQTVEILKRRGKALDSQVESLKAMTDDLKAQASFFDSTASDAAEGLVEIQEEYVEENSIEQESESGVNKQDVPSVPGDKVRSAEEDEEYARILARFEELEKEEELAAEKEKELAASNGGHQSDEEDEEEKETSDTSLEKFHDDKQNYSKASTFAWPTEENIGSNELLDKYQQQQECSGLSVQSSSKEDVSRGNNPLTQTQRVRNPNSAAKSVTFAEVKEKKQTLPPSTSEAFTGSIIERSPFIPKISKQDTDTPQASGSQPSKPVSRFKMQRR